MLALRHDFVLISKKNQLCAICYNKIENAFMKRKQEKSLLSASEGGREQVRLDAAGEKKVGLYIRYQLCIAILVPLILLRL